MARRLVRRSKPKPNPDFRHDTRLDIEGRLPMHVGRTFRVAGERGWWRCIDIVTHVPTDETWLDCVSTDRDGRRGDRPTGVRSFNPNRVTKVRRQL